MPGPLLIAALVCAILSALLLGVGLLAVRRHRWLGTTVGLLLGLLFLALAALAGTVSVATLGYRALVREELAATVSTEPTGDRRFRATFRFPDGKQASFELAGNALYVDAHIVKWHPFANVLGLHTGYQLDRVAGRYSALADEQRELRTVFSLSQARAVDMFDLARRLRFLAPLVDAEYGSATFAPTREPASLELRVSTTGLLFRPVHPPQRGPASPAAR